MDNLEYRVEYFTDVFDSSFEEKLNELATLDWKMIDRKYHGARETDSSGESTAFYSLVFERTLSGKRPGDFLQGSPTATC